MVYQGGAQYNITISGNMINPDAEIVFMPLHRSIKQTAKGSSGVAKQASSKVVATSAKVKDEPGTTIVKIAQAKPKAKKESKKTAAKNEKNKKDVAVKKDSKTEPKLPAKSDKPEPKVESKQLEQDVQAPEKTESKENINNNSANTSTATQGAVDSVVYVGQAEMDALQAQEYIQQELAQHWSPPTGMRSDLFAVVTLSIDFEGAIKKVDVTTSSGNLLFDTAAKKAAGHITPARWTYGKELSITFKP